MTKERFEILKGIIGDNFNLLFRVVDNSNYIDKWSLGQSYIPGQIAQADDDAKILLKDLLLNAIRNSAEHVDEFADTIQLLLEVNLKTPFVQPEDVELLNAAIHTKNLWVVYQILQLKLNLMTVPFQKTPQNADLKQLDLFALYKENKILDIREALRGNLALLSQRNAEGLTLMQLISQEQDQDKKILALNWIASHFSPVFFAYYLGLEAEEIVKMLVEKNYTFVDEKGPEDLTLKQLAIRDNRIDLRVFLPLSSSLLDLPQFKNKSIDRENANVMKIYDYFSINLNDKDQTNNLWAIVEASLYTKNKVSFWLSGRSPLSVEELFKDICANAKKMKNVTLYYVLSTMLLGALSTKDMAELKKNALIKQAELEKYLGKMPEQNQQKTQGEGASGEASESDDKIPESIEECEAMFLPLYWTAGVDFEKYHTGSLEYTAPHLLNDMLEMAVLNARTGGVKRLVEAHLNNKFIDTTRIGLVENAFKNVEIFKELLKCFDPNGSESRPLLFLALDTGKPEVIQALLDAGANAYQVNEAFNPSSFIAYARKRAKVRKDLQIDAILDAWEIAHVDLKPQEEPKELNPVVSFEVKGTYPKFDTIRFSFPAGDHNNVSVSKWFDERVIVTHAGDNISLYLGRKNDEGNVMSFIEVMEVLKGQGMILHHNAMAELQNTFRDVQRKSRKKKSPQSEKYQTLFEGLEALFPENQHLLRTDIVITEDDIKNAKPVPELIIRLDHPKWLAFGSAPDLSDEDKEAFYEFASFEDEKYNLNYFAIEVQDAVLNLRDYGAKLLREKAKLHKSEQKKQQEIDAKITHIVDLMKITLSQDDLSSSAAVEAVKEVYLKLEKEDKNRGTGLYPVHSFFKGKSYFDAEGKKHYVKSTTGELALNLWRALEKGVKNEEPDNSNVLSVETI